MNLTVCFRDLDTCSHSYGLWYWHIMTFFTQYHRVSLLTWIEQCFFISIFLIAAERQTNFSRLIDSEVQIFTLIDTTEFSSNPWLFLLVQWGLSRACWSCLFLELTSLRNFTVNSVESSSCFKDCCGAINSILLFGPNEPLGIRLGYRPTC
jgi:hypothetical protein